MASSAPVNLVMPGSFALDTTLPPKLDINGGDFFLPSKTPSATASLSAQHVNASRKRSRHDLYQPDQAAPSQAQSPGYRLAGGLDTPTARLTMGEEEAYQTSPNVHVRGFGGFKSAPDSYFPQSPSALSRESSWRPRQHASPRIQHGLGKAVYGMVQVAGKMWDFCRTTAFKGFYAGGGQGYEMKPPLEYTDGGQGMWQGAAHDHVDQSKPSGKSLAPGRFPEEDFIAEYMSQNHTTPPRAAKKIQREKGMGGDTSASWVLVSCETSPSRLSCRKTCPSNTSARKSVSKLGRRPILPASRPSRTSVAGSPGLRFDRSASFASPRSPFTSPKRESPLSAEVQRQAAKLRKRELEEDANLKRVNQQLKTMIKEGKEALGTKFEILESVDEGCAGG